MEPNKKKMEIRSFKKKDFIKQKIEEKENLKKII